MEQTIDHLILCHAHDAGAAAGHVRRFFERTMLLNYDHLEIDTEGILDGAAPRFWPLVETGVARNRAVLAGYLDELAATGCRTLEEAAAIDDPYGAKLLHLCAHMVDGFIGIDSAFYNLADDSHWLPAATAARIRRHPRQFYLLTVTGGFRSLDAAAVVHRRD